MSKYTTEVRYICETYAGYTESQDYDNVESIIEAARPKVFDFSFPIYDENYRSVLETKILKHYYTREIGFETVGLWKLWLNKRLNEIMPFYNQLYESETLEFNPFYDVNFDIKRDNTGKYDETSTSAGSSKSVRTDNLKENTTGSSTRTDNLKETTSDNSTRTDNLSEATTSDSTRTDNLKEESHTTNTRTDNLTEESGGSSTRTDNLTESTSSTTNTTTDATRTDNLAHSEDTTTSNTHYDLYSDTPQGALTGVNNETYLTNARKVTDSGSENTDGTNTGTVKNTGTQTVTGSGSTTNTGTQKTEDTNAKTNTGTQSNEGGGTVNNTGTQEVKATGSKANTGTQTVAASGSKDNTGTQTVATEGEKTNTGTQQIDGSTSGNGTKNYTNVDDYLEHVSGKRSYATYSEMLQKYRETFLNIDMMVIGELSDLFMNVW